eukprot:Skav212910  [mRNA]  locus=scaffold374:183339:189210:- [translate_table: standard]
MEWLGSALSPLDVESADVQYGYGARRPSSSSASASCLSSALTCVGSLSTMASTSEDYEDLHQGLAEEGELSPSKSALRRRLRDEWHSWHTYTVRLLLPLEEGKSFFTEDSWPPLGLFVQATGSLLEQHLSKGLSAQSGSKCCKHRTVRYARKHPDLGYTQGMCFLAAVTCSKGRNTAVAQQLFEDYMFRLDLLGHQSVEDVLIFIAALRKLPAQANLMFLCRQTLPGVRDQVRT